MELTLKKSSENANLLAAHEIKMAKMVDDLKNFDRTFQQMKKNIKAYEGLL